MLSWAKNGAQLEGAGALQSMNYTAKQEEAGQTVHPR